MNIKDQATQIDSIVAQGAIVDAVKQFFAEEATTSDYGGGSTSNKQEMIQKMEGFAGSIAAVNGITHHHTIVDGNVSASEFTFDFTMKDDSKIYCMKSFVVYGIQTAKLYKRNILTRINKS